VVLLQAMALLLIAAAGLGVVITREPSSQVIMFSFYGLLLAIMFVLFQAPAVGFSQVVAGAVVVPFLLLVALARVRRRAKPK
jgi:energy-converting hydrogenase B subunit D